MMELRVEHLCKRYGENAVLDDISFTARVGVTRLLGPSGIGKTTLLRVLLGLETPDSGTVNGDRFRWTAVFQENCLLEGLDAEGNLRFVLGANYNAAAAQALEVEHAVCRSFQQPLVVRNEQNGLFQSAYHLLQPYKRLKIQVVGRLVQQPDGGFLKKHLCEEQFDFLPARQRPHALIRPEKPRFHAQPARVFRQLARIRRIQCGRKKFHRADCGEFGFLREISRPLAAEISLSLSHGVFLRQFFVIKIFQQRRLSVPLFPDQGDFVSLVQRQREIFDDRQQIPAVV